MDWPCSQISQKHYVGFARSNQNVENNSLLIRRIKNGQLLRQGIVGSPGIASSGISDGAGDDDGVNSFAMGFVPSTDSRLLITSEDERCYHTKQTTCSALSAPPLLDGFKIIVGRPAVANPCH